MMQYLTHMNKPSIIGMILTLILVSFVIWHFVSVCSLNLQSNGKWNLLHLGTSQCF
jgi:hypothetical protein